MPWVRPAISVARCASASPASASTTVCASASRRSAALTISTESAVSTTSDDPRPRCRYLASGPLSSVIDLRNATTSCCVSVRSISSMRSGVPTRASARSRRATSTGTIPSCAGDLLDPLQECPGRVWEFIDGARVARLSPPRQVLIYWLHPHHGCGVWHRGKHTGSVSVRDADLHRVKSVEHVQFHYRKIGKTGDLGGEPRRDAIKPPAPARPPARPGAHLARPRAPGRPGLRTAPPPPPPPRRRPPPPGPPVPPRPAVPAGTPARAARRHGSRSAQPSPRIPAGSPDASCCV